MRGCLRTLTVILRHSKARAHITQPQLKVLLSFAQQDLFELSTQSVAFGLLRAIIARRLVCERGLYLKHTLSFTLSLSLSRCLPHKLSLAASLSLSLSHTLSLSDEFLSLWQVYDLIDKVSEHMVTSHSKQTQQLSTQPLLQFLLDYPLGDKRLFHLLQFLLRSLEFEYESGRKTALEVLHRVVARLSIELLEAYLELVFLSLVVRLVNDDIATCRRIVALLLKDLLARCPRKQLDSLLDVAVAWSTGGEPTLRRATVHLLGILVEQQGASAERLVDKLLPAFTQALARTTRADWEEAYHILVASDKLIAALPKVLPLWLSLSLSHTHTGSDGSLTHSRRCCTLSGATSRRPASSLQQPSRTSTHGCSWLRRACWGARSARSTRRRRGREHRARGWCGFAGGRPPSSGHWPRRSRAKDSTRRLASRRCGT